MKKEEIIKNRIYQQRKALSTQFISGLFIGMILYAMMSKIFNLIIGF